MDDASGGRWWTALRHMLGGRSDTAIEEAIQDARDDGELERKEASMLLNVLRMEDTLAREIMVPRTRVIFGDTDQSLEEMAQLFIDSGYSRVPVFRESKDDIVGIIHVKDLLKAFTGQTEPRPSLESLLRPAHFFQEDTNLKNLLLDFQAKKTHLGIAQDEYGGTSGIVTMEDILEEIVGEIEDEYDVPGPASIQELRDGKLLVSGLTSLDDLNQMIAPPLESEQVETLGGFVSEIAGRVPRKQENFVANGHSMTIKDADDRHVRWIVVTPAGRKTDEMD